MWGKNSDMPFSNNHTLFAKGTEVVGDVHFDGELDLEGKVRGNIIADGSGSAKVSVSDKGMVEGEIRAPNILINGSITGDVHSAKHIELGATAVVNGNVHYQLIEMVKGSQVNGNLVYSGEKTGQPASKPLLEDKPEVMVTGPRQPANS